MDSGKSPKPNSNIAVEAAESATRSHDWREASRLWQGIADERGPKTSAKVWAKLAQSHRLAGDLKRALKAAKKGLKAYPLERELHKEVAKTFAAVENWSDAVAAWGRTVELFGEQATDEMRLELNRSRAMLAAQKKQWEEALRSWQLVAEQLEDGPASSLKLQARFSVSIIRRILNIDEYRREIRAYHAYSRPRKIAIITAVSKGYDTVKPPETIDPRIDYLVFTDDSSVNSMGIFEIKPFPKDCGDPARSIRYVKTHPHILFKKYEVVVWLDTAVMIVGDIYPLIEKFNTSKAVIGSGVHPLRKSIYEEYEACLRLGKGDPAIMRKQIDRYKSEEFEHDDLSENTMLMFKPGAPSVADAMGTWWEQIMRFSARDQLSFNYSLAKNNVKYFPLTKSPQDIRNHPDFVWMPHHKEQKALDELIRML